MGCKVLVFGTDHRFQRRSPEFTEQQHQQFADYISCVAKANSVAALAEENNLQALEEVGVVESTVKCLAHELGLKHRYCDPDMKTRAALGIRQENQIRISVFPDRLPQEEVQQQLKESMRARERYWLSELVEFNTWPVLYFCGANHSLPFTELLQKNNVATVLVAQDWVA